MDGCITLTLTANTLYYFLVQGQSGNTTIPATVYLYEGLPLSGSEQPANLAAFNDTNYVKNNNCYTYALNTLVNPITNQKYGFRGTNPGLMDGSGAITEESLTVQNAATLIPQEVRDDCVDWGGSANDFYLVDAETRVPDGYYKVALFAGDVISKITSTRVFTDYHWFRQASDLAGMWAHKAGISDATNIYGSSNILMPHTLAYSIEEDTAYANYTFIGYYAIKPPSVTTNQ